MIRCLLLICVLFVIAGCQKTSSTESIVSMQVIDRNGFSETISNKERLQIYQNVNFLSSQPYETVLRVYGKNEEGKNASKLTSYHENGSIWQYLEAVDGRAHGKYLEWHENGKIKIEAHAIEGLADLSETAQTSWIFDGESSVWDENGSLMASFHYDKGNLVGEAKYYYPDGKLSKIVPYDRGQAHGILQIFDQDGHIHQTIPYHQGQKNGNAIFYWNDNQTQASEKYEMGLLKSGEYYTPQNQLISEVIGGSGYRIVFNGDKIHSKTEYRQGTPEGKVELYDTQEKIYTSYQIKNGKKNGEEWEYYKESPDAPKMYIHWVDDQIQGMVKTWYQNGKLESQKEMSNNKKQGLSFAYYPTGDLMLMEEYDNDKLVKGSYYKKGETTPTSSVEKGEGIVSLFTQEGYFSQKIPYENGKPVVE